MTKVSPGPWVIDDNCIRSSNEENVLGAYTEHVGGYGERGAFEVWNDVDKRAILATPRTLELLRRLADAADQAAIDYAGEYATTYVTPSDVVEARALLIEIEGDQ